MYKRDASIKMKLVSMESNAEEVKELEEKANAVMATARVEIAATLNKMQKGTMAEVDEMVEAGRLKMETELMEALENLEGQKVDTIKALDAQAAELSREIVKKGLPAA